MTFQPLLVLVLPVLLQREPGGLGRENEEEGLVSVLVDAVAVQRLLVLGQALANHPALQQGVEAEIVADLRKGRREGTAAFTGISLKQASMNSKATARAG